MTSQTPAWLSEDAVGLAARVKSRHTDAHNMLVVTGLAEGDGVTAATAQIAAALARMGEGRVLIVDANLRRPRLHAWFAVDREPGLTELLRGGKSVDDACRPTATAGLYVLPAGGDEGDALSLLISTATAEAFAALRAAHHFVLIDAPPFRQHAETALLAGRADGVVVAIARGRHKRDDMREIQLALEGLSVPLTGVILTERESRMRRWLGRSARSGGDPWTRA